MICAMDLNRTKPISRYALKTRILTILALFALFIALGGIVWQKKYAPGKELSVAPLPKSSVPTKNEPFTISLMPGELLFTAGTAAEKTTKIFVVPIGDSPESVAFSIVDIGNFGAHFVEDTLKNEDFGNGVTLAVTSDKKMSKGAYVITFRAKSKEVEREFIVPISVE